VSTGAGVRFSQMVTPFLSWSRVGFRVVRLIAVAMNIHVYRLRKLIEIGVKRRALRSRSW